MGTWGFYGRTREQDDLADILSRERWFFARITGRRRIGKTTLIQQVLEGRDRRVFYVQIPDSAPAGVLSAFADAMETFVHLDIASILEILDVHTGRFDPQRLLFLWNLFEGVPKFYRDCFEQACSVRTDASYCAQCSSGARRRSRPRPRTGS